MAEDPEEDAFAARLGSGRRADAAEDLGGVVAQAELEEAVAELLAIAGAADPDAFLLEDLGARRCVDVSSSRSQRGTGLSPCSSS